jgi:transposase, IS30 family
MACTGLSLNEREEIRACLAEDSLMTWTELGRRVGRHRSTIQREVARHQGRHRYRAVVADSVARLARHRDKTPKLVADPILAARVTSELQAGVAPAAIAAKLVREHQATVCAETIYTSVWAGGKRGLVAGIHRCLPSKRARRKPRHTCSKALSPLGIVVTIHDRPDDINQRLTPHFEGDLITGAFNRSAVVTLVERISRYTLLADLPDGHGATQVLAALIELYERIPIELRRFGLTWDRGSELACHRDFALTYDCTVYFADPHSPWQRGTNENTNRVLRRWMPKSTNLNLHTRDDLRRYENTINTSPRRLLNWDTPTERYHALTAH